MTDYLKIFEKFKDVKEIEDLISAVVKLRLYFNTQQYKKMQKHINDLTHKYLADTILWNLGHQEMPTTYEQSYINAENFLQIQGAKIIVKKIVNYNEYLTLEEITFIESILNM